MGDMVSGQMNGEGTLYLLDDFFAGYKVDGCWQDGVISGVGRITTKTYTEVGNYIYGKKMGTFIRNYIDGSCSIVKYNDDVNLSEEFYVKHKNKQSATFGSVKLSKSLYYLGDIFNGIPLGYGMVYNVDNENKFVGKTFGEICDRKFLPMVDFGNSKKCNEDFLK